MFKLQDNWNFEAEIQIFAPGREAETFTAQFQMGKNWRAPTPEGLLTDGEAEVAYIRKVFVGWSGIAEDDGTAVAFSEEERETLIHLPFVRGPLIEAFYTEALGQQKGN